MKETTHWLEFASGSRKYVHCWQPPSAAWASVAIVHGLGEHGGRYHPLARDWAQAGLAVAAFDQQGHGRSPEARGRIRSYASMLDDIRDFLIWHQAQQPELPVFLFGHSMGGNLVINYALRQQVLPLGVISSSPMIRMTTPPGAAFVALARVLSKLLPNFTLRSQVVAEHLMSDPHEQQLLRDDRLFHSQVTLRLGAALFDSGPWAIEHAHQLRVPLFLSHGTLDTRTSHLASTEFAERAGRLCQLTILPEELHDPFRGLSREAIIDRFVQFMRETAAGSANS